MGGEGLAVVEGGKKGRKVEGGKEGKGRREGGEGRERGGRKVQPQWWQRLGLGDRPAMAWWSDWTMVSWWKDCTVRVGRMLRWKVAGWYLGQEVRRMFCAE